MNNTIMTLLWKDVRNNFWLLVFASLVLFLPTIGIASYIITAETAERRWDAGLSAGLLGGSITSLILSQFTMLCLGGHAFAGERTIPTFRFLFYQPATRMQIALSKLLFCLLVAAVIWVVSVLFIIWGLSFFPPNQGPEMEFPLFTEIAAAGLLMFGTAWYMSSRVESSVFAMSLGTLATVSVFLILQGIHYKFGTVIEITGQDWTRIILFSLIGITTVVAGLIVFIKRIEP